MGHTFHGAPLNLDPFWMPFTANRQYKSAPRLLVAAQDMHYTDIDGRKILDGTAGLWCCNAGHNRKPIVEAIQRQAATMDFAPTFQMGHPEAFIAAEKIAEMAPKGLGRVFFTNSGSEAADTALKMALAYHRMKGDSLRTKLIGRERGYHGVGFGGIAVGGIAGNRKHYGVGMPGVDHIRHTLDIGRNAFTRGEPEAGGIELANELETRITTLHDPSTIAALIVEPIAGSTGVIIPPKGYLKRLREICDKYGILLIFDEVITGFGRLGSAWGATYFDVIPDILTCAKGLSNATVPIGAVLATDAIHDAFMNAAAENTIEFFHGYTYSGHPLATAAATATLDLYKAEGLFERARDLSGYFADGAHSLKGLPFVKDVRNLGLVAAIELEGIPGKPTARAFAAFLKCWEKGLLIRTTGDIIALSPPLIIEKEHIDQLFGTLAEVLKAQG
jgi:beta-alanine--pyruvate transaminase